MKNRAIRIALALTGLLGIFAFMLSCGDQAANNTKTGAPANADPGVAAAPCPSGLDARVTAIGTAVNTAILRDPLLLRDKEQSKFDVVVSRYPDTSTGKVIVMRVQGTLRGFQQPVDTSKPEERDGSLRSLFKIIEKYVQKGCLDKVIFEPMPSGGTLTESRFEWGACDNGKIMCNGVCQTTCDGMIPKESPPTNANSNVNTNAPANPNPGNTGSNSTNANRSNSNTGPNTGP